MKNTNIADVSSHAYDREAANKWLEIIHPETKTFSVGIFKWELTKDGKALKSSKVLVRVIGHPQKAQYVFETADKVVSRLNEGTWYGSKSVKV